VAARLRLPPEVRDPDPDGPSLEARARMLVVRSLRRWRLAEAGYGEEAAAFLSPIEGHLSLLLDVALLQGGAFDAARRRAELAAFFAASLGETAAALAALPRENGEISEAAARKAFERAGAALRRRSYPPGDPVGGIPLYAGTVAVERRLLARIAIGFFRKGALDRSSLAGYLSYAEHETRLLVEALAGLAAADGPLDAQRRRMVLRQAARLELSREAERELRARLRETRSAREVARAAPARMRVFLVGQLLLALVTGPASPSREAWVSAFAEVAQIGPERLAALRAEAEAFRADHAQLFREFGVPEPEWHDLAEEWEEVGGHMMQRAMAILSANLDSIVTEIRRTGELAQLLGKFSMGRTLTSEEKRKVKEHLIDLAKTVPALAIFAAPGGMLLLPLLAKLLPANFWPSAFQPNGRKGGPAEGGKGEGGEPGA
jgi:hypothetical protein